MNWFSKIFLTLTFLNVAYSGWAQDGWPLPLRLSQSYICDTTPWKLILTDSFNGNHLDRNKWFDFNATNNGNDDRWGDSRIEGPAIYRSENCVVSDGTLKLIVKQGINSWSYPGMEKTDTIRNYSSGYICTRMNFNSGKLVARMKHPIFKGAWSTAWTWACNKGDEIDFAESRSKKGYIAWPYQPMTASNRPHIGWATHYFPPLPGRANPYNIKDDSGLGEWYPNQEWINFYNNTRFKYEDWHTYTCEWDTASIAFYLDDVLIDKIWKYYYSKSKNWRSPATGANYDFKLRIPATCNVDTSLLWHISKGYPFNSDSSWSKLILGTTMMYPEKIFDKDGVLGQMEIDYVNIYQRHPEKDGHKAIAVLDEKKAIQPSELKPEQEKALVLTSLNRNYLDQKQYFTLSPSMVLPGASYYWKVSWGYSPRDIIGSSETKVAYLMLPEFAFGKAYYLKWELQVEAAGVVKTLRGERSGTSKANISLSHPETMMDVDSTVLNFETAFKSQSDIDKYEQAIKASVESRFFEHVEDTAAINQTIAGIAIKALEPFWVFKDFETDLPQTMAEVLAKGLDKTFLYATNSNKAIGFIFSKKIDVLKDISFKLLDNKRQNISSGLITQAIDISGLQRGRYAVQIAQGEQLETLVFQKL